MRQALGLIETQGLIGAIEASDVMLKAAEVHLIGKEIIGGGLVTVLVEGDVAAVKTAVDAGSAAVKTLSQPSLLSSHVIPRPDCELEAIMPKNEYQEEIVIVVEEEEGSQLIENSSPETSLTEDVVLEDEVQLLETIPEELTKEQQLAKWMEDGQEDLAKQWLEGKKVSELRVLAKKCPNFPLTKKEVHQVSKRKLIDIVLTYFKK